MKRIDLNSWTRHTHYKYFKDFKNPFFNICADVDVSNIRKLSKEHKISYFILSAYALMKSVNDIEEFKYRMDGEGVVRYDKIRVSCTVIRPDGTFGFAYLKHEEDFNRFYEEASKEIDEVKNSNVLDPQIGITDMVYTSVLPSISFKSVEHAQNNYDWDSIPKFVFGKLYERDGKVYMPCSVSVHHSMMDAMHVGFFFSKYEEVCNALCI